MRKFTKKAFCIFTAAAVTAGALSLTACGKDFKPVAPDNSENVTSNGGFVVATDDYFYFINGVEDYAADNTYGDVVKGALMRVKKSDVSQKKNTAETVVPALMVADDTSAGVFIYGGRIYYATPNDVKNTTGEVEKDYLNFKSAKTDGSDVKDILRVSDKSTKYRFVEAGEDKTVYLVYVQDKELRSYNTKTNEDTVLAKDGTYVFNDADKSDPYIYYTMSVADKKDSEFPVSYKYNQIYRVRADATEAPYEYKWDQEWLDENNDGEAPYVNLGELVLDGVGKTDLGMTDKIDVTATQFNHDVAANMSNCPEIGYVYTLQNYTNGGIYYKRTLVTVPGSTVGSEGELYYLPASLLVAGWNTVSGNDGRDEIANSTNLSKASSSALYYTENGEHHYLYVSGSNIYRADVKEKGEMQEQAIAFDASGATLVSIDTTSSSDYHYVYYSRSNNGGLSVERAVFNGEEENYKNLSLGDPSVTKEPFESVKLLNIQHASGWYNYEVVDGTLFYANAESFGESLNYVYAVNLNNASGKLMNNVELKELNKKYDSIFSSDKKVGYLEEVKAGEGGSGVADALKYYFYTGESKLVWENIQDARDEGKKESYITKNLYSEAQQKLIAAFTGEEKRFEGLEKSKDLARFLDGETSYFNVNYFTTMLGKMTDEDRDAVNDYWKTSVLKHYTPESEETGGGLAWWAWLLISIGIAAVLAGGGVGVYFFLKKKKTQESKPEKMRVDTTDDKSVDVYGMNAENAASGEETQGAEEAPATPAEAAEEPAEAAETEEISGGEAPAEIPEETSAEESAAENVEEPKNETDSDNE